MQELFHYTTFSRLKRIQQNRMILPATAAVQPHEKPVVWLTYSPEWEPTATPGVRDQEGTINSMYAADTAHVSCFAVCFFSGNMV